MTRHGLNGNRCVVTASHRGPLGRGFTLVELLVVIAIIGTLVGLLLPAVFSALQSAKRIQCLNKVKQIALATHNYQTAFKGQLPSNWGVVSTAAPTSSTGGTTQGASWLSSILPYIEEETLFKSMRVGKQLGHKEANLGIDNETAARTKVAPFICPADGNRGTMNNQAIGTGDWGVTNYKAVAGCIWKVSVNPSTGDVSNTAVTWPSGRNSTLNGAANTDGLDHGNGPIYRGGVSTVPATPPIYTTIDDIKRGTSKTFLVGEAIPDACAWSVWFWFDGSTATCGIPLNYVKPKTLLIGMASDPWYSYSFRSNHNGGANFGFCDGSGRFISTTVDTTVYRGLAVIDGRVNVQTPD